jgi:uncharacterized protein (DUF983 family)
MTHNQITHLSPFSTGFKGRCPECGEGKLFEGFLSLKPKCEACGLAFDFADSGDGPAVFIILFAGFLVVALALFVEVRFMPPYWVHAVLWIPLVLFTCIAPIRPLKGLMIAQQYVHKAAEGRVDHA